ncbi:MAG TPA: BON domain-containing protein [Armatimonadota bacterium]|jgi:osmotically-inducible protein OsmY
MRILIALGVVLLAAGCGPRQKPPAGLEPATEAGKAVETAAKNPRGTAEDVTVTAAVKTSFSLNKALNGSNINVTTNKGVVLLEGHVASARQKAEAARQAKLVEGVKAVTNRLTVSPAGG